MCKYIFLFFIFLSSAVYSQQKSTEPTLVTVGPGWAKNSVNTTIFRRNSLVTYKNIQYIAYYNENGQVVLGKRKLNSAKWQLHTTQYKGNVRDAHNSISIIVDGDGFLHMSWDHHNNNLRYCKSKTPGSLEMTGRLWMTGKKENNVTYPEFYKLPDGNLLFLYRDGSSGNGNLMLNFYNTRLRKWSQLQDGWVHGEGQRNAYWQMTTDKKGRIHLSWVWRESGDVATNHDICYARSVDGGKTWEKSNGEKYALPITAGTAEYALKIPQKSELINTTSMVADAEGRPYIVSYWRDSTSKVPQYHLVYNDGGKWIITQISKRVTPFTLSGGGTKRIPISRPQIMVDVKNKKSRALVVYRDIEQNEKASVALCDDLSAGIWYNQNLNSESLGSWEPSYDTELWKRKRILNLFIQKVEQGDGERTKEIPAQEVKVLQWKPVWK